MRDVNRAMHTQKKSGLHEVLPKAGLVVSEKGNLTEILCKPKILPLKSITLQKLEEMEVGTASACMQVPVRPVQHTFSIHALHQHVLCRGMQRGRVPNLCRCGRPRWRSSTRSSRCSRSSLGLTASSS